MASQRIFLAKVGKPWYHNSKAEAMEAAGAIAIAHNMDELFDRINK